MSYLNRTTNPRQRSTAIAGVIAIHALLGYVVLTGFIQHIGPRHRDIFSGTLYPEPPPPPPQPPQEEQQKPKKVEEKQTAPEPRTDLTADDRQVETTHEDSTVTDDLGKTTIVDPPLPPLPRVTPRGASPRNSPGSWAMTDDYPARDLREGNEGTTAFRVAISASGRVTGCEIVRSSGHPGLDAATCKAVAARARFAPATDENGNTVAGTYSNSVRWQIPR